MTLLNIAQHKKNSSFNNINLTLKHPNVEAKVSITALFAVIAAEAFFADAIVLLIRHPNLYALTDLTK